PFDDLETNLPEAESASVIKTCYVCMLLELNYIPWFYNTSASAAHWALLTRYLVIPGIFTSLQKSNFLTEGLEMNCAGKAILKSAPPCYHLLFDGSGLSNDFLANLGAEGELHMAYKLVVYVSLPVLLNVIAGLLTTFINVYTAQNGEWLIIAVVMVIITRMSIAVALSLTIIYKFRKLERVKREYEMEIKASFHVVSHKASDPSTGEVGPGS
ncbi:hypothetical protein GB937_010639, partial [Aspergillus fischeri]